MTKGTSVALMALALTVGCGKEPETKPAPSTPAPPQQMTQVATDVAQETAPPPDVPQGTTAPATPPELEAPTDPDKAALDALNAALSHYSDPSSRPNAGDLTESATKQYPPIKDLNDLVRAGFIKAIPAAPAGKKYAIDPKSGAIVLANQ